MSNPADPDPASHANALDRLRHLPFKESASVALVLAIAGFHAFNDIMLKMMLVGLAPQLVARSLGGHIGVWLGAMIWLPAILVAPLAGFFADRYSKRHVIMTVLMAQALTLLVTGVFFQFQLGWFDNGFAFAMVAFFLLALQSAFFSPGRMGVLKELAGSRRLGMISGWLQTVTTIAILNGLWLGERGFAELSAHPNDFGFAGSHPIWILFGLAMVAVITSYFIQPTPAHPQIEFRKELLWDHFAQLAEPLRHRGLRRACLGNAVYWFVATMAGAMFIDIGILLRQETAATIISRVGFGTVAGSVFVSWVNRRGLQLGIVPLAALGLAAALIWAGASEVGSRSFEWPLITMGFMGGCYLVPIQAYIQERADPAKRGRVIAAANLLDSLAAILAVSLLVLLKTLGLTYHGQFWVLGALMMVAAFYMVRILPQDVVRFVAVFIMRTIYKIKSVDASHIPAKGGVLLLPNHISYVDAFVIGAACPRPVRFVMWDQLYNIKSVNWLLRILGTVPISATRAKDAVRNVAAALKENEVVCLFPEGQITRHGMMNELRRGFELMARQGDAPVVPVHLDGLYGSIFSYKGGICFKKWPRKLRYPVVVRFGEALPPRETDAETVRQKMRALSSAAFLARPAVADEGSDGQAKANALRLLDIEWARKNNTLLCLSPIGSAACQTVACYAALDPVVTLEKDAAAILPLPARSVIVIGSAAELKSASELSTWREKIRFIACWDPALDEQQRGEIEAALQLPVLRGWLDEGSGALISVSVPDPEMPVSDRGSQHGARAGSLGHLLPGLAARKLDEGIEISGLRPASQAVVFLPNVSLSDDGFLLPPDSISNETRPRQ